LLGANPNRARAALIIDAKGATTATLVISSVLGVLERLGLAPASTDRFQVALSALNRAHGLDMPPEAAQEASDASEAFLIELRRITSGEEP